MQRLGVIAILAILIYSLFLKKYESGEPGVLSKILQETQTELYPGCNSMTRLSFIMRMLHGKTKTHMTNRAFNFVFGELKKNCLQKLTFRNHMLRLREFFLKLVWVMRQLMYVSMTAVCFGETMPTELIVPSVVIQGGDTRIGRERFLTRSFGTFR